MIGDEHHGHAHKSGIPWLDLVIAGSAIVVSVVSLVVSVGHGRTMEKLVEANALQVKASTLPILRFTHGNLDEKTERPRVHFDLTNGGTGPAIIQWLTLSYDGKPVAGIPALLRACCGQKPGEDSGQTYNNVATGQTLGAGQSSEIFAMRPPQAGDRRVWDTLESGGRFRIGARACFCSVLDACWITEFGRSQPRPVTTCGAPPAGSW